MTDEFSLICENCGKEVRGSINEEEPDSRRCSNCGRILRVDSAESGDGSGGRSELFETVAPDRNPFLYFSVLKSSVFLGIVFVVGFVLGWIFLGTYVNTVTAGGYWLLFGGVLALVYYNRRIQFEKEQYEFQKDHLVVRSGTMFSDHTVELPIRKITNVTLTFPFLENTVFGTGSVRVESAGAQGGVVQMSCLKNPEKIYERIQELMTRNGFRLEQDNLIMKETPNTLGCLLNSGLNVLRFLDKKRRVYSLYDDCVSYTDGFLTEVHRLIPLENLADTETVQTPVDRLLNIYNINVSCQGTGGQMYFGSLENRGFEERLSELIEETESLETAERRREPEREEMEEADARVAERRRKRESVTSRDFTTTLGPDVTRMLVPGFVLLPFCLIGLPVMGVLYVLAKVTTYRVKKDSIEHELDFIARKTTEFSNDKITGMIVRENIIDRWMGTVSIRFWSIGSDSTITFSHLPRSSKVVERLLEAEGYKDGEVQHDFRPEVDPATFFLGNPYGTTVGLILLAISVVGGWFIPLLFLGVGVVPLLAVIFYVWSLKYFEKASFEFYETFVRYVEGYMFKSEYYVDYDDVKDVTSTRYAGLDSGKTVLGVAGESGGDEKNQAFRSYEIRVKYLENLFERDRVINDRIGLKRWDRELLQESRPDPQNAIVGSVIGCVVLTVVAGVGAAAAFPALLVPAIGGALALYAPIIGGTYWSVSVIQFSITPRGIVRESGIFYRTRQTILFENIDHIDKGEGLLNKVFGNGTIKIYTVGSSSCEMVLSDTPDYRRLYERIQNLYKG